MLSQVRGHVLCEVHNYNMPAGLKVSQISTDGVRLFINVE